MDKNEFLAYVGIVGAFVMVLVTTGTLGPTLITVWTLASGVLESLTLPEGA